jgi:hypothetical protein
MSLPGRRNPMITALEMGAALLLTATLLAAGMVLAGFHLGSLATRDDEQLRPRLRARARRAFATPCHRRAPSGVR